MTERHKGAEDPAQDAARLEEIRQLTDDIKRLMRERIVGWRMQADLSGTEITKRVGELHSAHLKLVEQERIFYAKLGLDIEEDAIDYDEVRAEIGRGMGPLDGRGSHATEGRPCEAAGACGRDHGAGA